jgi:hypothetical protein
MTAYRAKATVSFVLSTGCGYCVGHDARPDKIGRRDGGLSVRILWSADRKRDYYLLC